MYKIKKFLLNDLSMALYLPFAFLYICLLLLSANAVFFALVYIVLVVTCLFRMRIRVKKIRSLDFFIVDDEKHCSSTKPKMDNDKPI